MKLLQPFRVLWKLWFLIVFVSTLLLLYPAFRLLFSKEKYFPSAFRLMRLWAWMLTSFNGIWMSKLKAAPLPEKPYIICANHSSYLDIITMYRVFGQYFIFMGKSELNSWPLFNIFFTKGMNISVDRKSVVGAGAAYDRAKNELDKNHNLVIFPEATIPPSAPQLKPFKNGAFKLSMEKGVPIVPVTYLNNWKRLQAGAALKVKGGPGPSKVIVHAPVFPQDFKDISEYRQRVFDVINEPLQLQYGN